MFLIFEILRKEILGVIFPRGKICIDIFPMTHYFGATGCDGRTDPGLLCVHMIFIKI
jgi:hypothetical protein